MRVKVSTILKLFFVIVFIALLEPNGFLNSPIHRVMGLLRYGGFFISVLLFVHARIYSNRSAVLLLCIVAWMGVSTLAFSKELSDSYIYTFISLTSTIILSTYGLQRFPKFFVLMLATIFSMWIFLDGLTWTETGLFLTVNGQKAYFLGTKTTITYYLVPAFAFDYIALKITEKRLHTYAKLLCFINLSGAVIYLVQEPISTAILCSVLALIGYVVVAKFDMISSFISRFGFWITGGLCFAFITGSAISTFSSFFENVLNERTGLNGRTEIWNMVLERFSERPFIGFGYSSQVKFDAWQAYNTSTHNYFLHLLFTMGIIGFALYTVYIIMIHKNNKYYLSSDIHRYLMFILMILNIEGITESYGFNVMTFSLMIAIVNVGKVIEIAQQKNEFSFANTEPV